MTEYDFVSIPITRHRDGHRLADDYRLVIRERAERGWKFVQAIPFDTHSEPRFDLVFTRKGGSR
ncbi:DUF4177 domain-containing protein [Microbacterium sp. NPDC077644]|uniref:DUF4177 domain-containing protein n=1 Tax=Microbacterium sp. NPDC077644 TaxID=3155055 RepID=UPI00344F3504